jgi:hypothetical protein
VTICVSRQQKASDPQGAAFVEETPHRRAVALLEGRVERLKRDGHPLESGCPIRKGEEVSHARDSVPVVVNELAIHVGVRETFGQYGGGGGDDERDGEDELLHGSSPLSV